MRAYVPITVDALVNSPLTPTGTWDVPAGIVHTVTPQLVAAFPDADTEELEWVAFNAAADDSLALAAQNPGATPLRAVLSVDVPDGAVTALPPESENSVASRGQTVAVPGATVASLHVDEPAVGQLITAVQRGGQFTQAQARMLDDAHLLWYHPAEIAALVGDSRSVEK